MASITAEQAKEIASMKRDDALENLSEILGLGPVSDDGFDQHTILLDYVYDTLMHAISRGFPWDQACTVFTLAYSMISLSKDKTLTETIQIYKKECLVCENRVSSQNLKIFTDYFFQTFMGHFKLYQYVFNKSRDVQNAKVHLQVETPPEPRQFTEGKDVSIWEYEQKIQQIEQTEKERKNERENEQEVSRKQHDEVISDALQDLETEGQPMDREKLMAIIQSVASAQISATSSRLVTTIEEALEDLEFKLEKTTLPRPAELDPPSLLIVDVPANYAMTAIYEDTTLAEGMATSMANHSSMSPPPRHKTKTPQSALTKSQKSATRVKSGKGQLASGKKGKSK